MFVVGRAQQGQHVQRAPSDRAGAGSAHVDLRHPPKRGLSEVPKIFFISRRELVCGWY